MIVSRRVLFAAFCGWCAGVVLACTVVGCPISDPTCECGPGEIVSRCIEECSESTDANATSKASEAATSTDAGTP